MISRSSNVAAATQTRPEERIFPTIDRASLNWGGGWIHNTATGDSLRIVHSRTRSYCLSSSVSGARQGNPNPRYYSLARREYGSTGNALRRRRKCMEQPPSLGSRSSRCAGASR
jgi:hypothetical protein